MAAADYIFGTKADAVQLMGWLRPLPPNEVVDNVMKQCQFSIDNLCDDGELSRSKLVYIGDELKVYQLLMHCPIAEIKGEMKSHCVHSTKKNGKKITCGKCKNKWSVTEKRYDYYCPACGINGWTNEDVK